MNEAWPYFVRELTKIAVQLSDKEKRRQALQFAALGATAAPIASGAQNLLTYGRLSPWKASRLRWLGGSMAAGLIGGAAVPYVRHAIERKSQEDAGERLRRMRISSALKAYHRATSGE